MEPSDIILQGRRYCESISEYTLLEDLTWLREENKWVIKFSLSGTYEASPFVPSQTIWYAFLSTEYPYGDLSILPANVDSIEATFPHMNYNKDQGKQWRTGDICIKTNYGAWKSTYFNSEPFDVTRLQWSIKRSISWIEAASKGTLQVEGDPFEFPHFPSRSKILWAFCETPDLFPVWNSTSDNKGVLQFFIPHFNQNVAVVSSYNDNNHTAIKYEWGVGVTDKQAELENALWVKFPEIPVMEPWKIPMNWGELFNLCEKKGWDLKSFLKEKLIKEKMLGNAKVLALGFPVSEIIGQPYERLHWFAIRLPRLLKKLNGFRTNTIEWRSAQFSGVFAGHQSINWLNAENWAKDQITTRGALDHSFADLNICVVGVGAVGSYLSELLARLGCEKFTLIDNDGVSIGNLSRHTLTMSSLVQYKTDKIAERLNQIFPHISAISKTSSLKKLTDDDPQFLNNFGLIIDCTADDDVLLTLEAKCNLKEQVIFSVSLGQEAQSLIAFMIRSPFQNLIAEFKSKSEIWSEKQRQMYPNPNFPLEGIGCWHPIFPARIDDIQSLVASTIRQFEIFLRSSDLSKMVIIERNENGNILINNE